MNKFIMFKELESQCGPRGVRNRKSGMRAGPKSPLGHDKEFTFDSISIREPLEYVKKVSNMI